MSSPSARIAVVVADITTLAVDAIVNAANEALAPGGGVDGAIRRAAGPEINRATDRLGGCPTGEAVITPGFRLPARFVIHTVGPVWDDADPARMDRLLGSCYRASLALCDAHALATVAFPAISTGIYGFPIERAAGIAVGACLEHLKTSACPAAITLCCSSNRHVDAYRAALAVRQE